MSQIKDPYCFMRETHAINNTYELISLKINMASQRYRRSMATLKMNKNLLDLLSTNPVASFNTDNTDM